MTAIPLPCVRVRRAQGAFEYILLLAGILLIVVVVITVLRVSVIPAANQTLAAGLQQWQALVNFCQDESTAILGIDGATATIALCQSTVPEQTVVTISSAPITFDGSNSGDRQYMNWSSDNRTVVLNITGKAGSPLNLSESHGITVVVAGTTLISAKTALRGCTPSEHVADANTVGLWHFNDNGPNPLTADSSTVGLWHFDSINASNYTLDVSNNRNDGFVNGSLLADAGRLGGALSFNGINNYVEVPHSQSLNITGAITLEAWVKTNDLQPVPKVILHKISADLSNRSYGLVLSTRQDNGSAYTFKLELYSDGATQIYQESATRPVPGRWYHVVGVFIPGSKMDVYVNGLLDDSSTPSIPSSLYPGNAKPLYIGGIKGSGWNSTINGSIDEVAVYNRALSAAEIAQHAGVLARDASQYANNGTLVNGTNWTTGRYENAVQFDGMNDYINAGNRSSLSVTGNITLEAWVKHYGGGDCYGGLVGKRYNNTYLSYTMFYAVSGCLGGFGVSTSSSWQEADTRPLPTNAWTHLAGTYDGSKVRFYVNGIENVSANLNGSIKVYPADLVMGKLDARGTFFNGAIDEVRILNRALNASEVYYDRWCH